ncbi:MAG: aspartate/glutamate racemase family protein [Candidatus Gracilibacteria bacterium]
MIGIFDSGSGGLTFLAAMRARCPKYSYIYFGDYDNCPYGAKSPEEIQTFTTAGVQKLFDAGATIVILACNTASAWTLRKLQTEVFPDKRILGVTIPGAEKVIELGLKKVTVFATQQTVNSRTYRDRVGILDESVEIEEIALSGYLVKEIESLLPVQKCHSQEDFQKILQFYNEGEWNCVSDDWENLIQKYFSQYHPKEGIVLGCTHYPYLQRHLQKLFPVCKIIDPSEESAVALERYIERHKLSLSQTGKLIFTS